ncbi:MAG: MFS transporter [Aeoliella sp.]
MTESTHSKQLFWGCFLALVTTAFGFIARMFLIPTWAEEFNLDPAQQGRLIGIGIWPFAVSIIGFSLFIDRIGDKTAMTFSFLGYLVWSIMGVSAFFVSDGGKGDTDLGFALLYWGSLILGLSNGTVEAYINPVVATMFKEEKTKWLNILHAGWPGGLVLAGLITIGLDYIAGDTFVIPWWIKIGIIAPPAVIFFLMLVPLKFPTQERVASGVTYREMLAEFGVLGALIVGFLVTLQLMDFYSNGSEIALETSQKYMFIGIGVAIVVAFGLYTRSLGRPLLFVLALIMMPLATTEIGTDGWITSIMEGVFEDVHPGWVLVYTSVIMMVLRFFAGSIVHQISPLGLLAVSAILAIAGLYWLSFASGVVIFWAATVYAFGKTFFWPTMLGVASEQTPRGGALTLNALGGIGMLAVGTLGAPYIGALQAAQENKEVAANEEIVTALPGLIEGEKLTVLKEKTIYEIIPYETIDDDRLTEELSTVPEVDRKALDEQITEVRGRSKQGALANMCVFPAAMLVAYIALAFYFKSRGGYQAEVLTGHAAQDERFTGGVEGPAEP